MKFMFNDARNTFDTAEEISYKLRKDGVISVDDVLVLTDSAICIEDCSPFDDSSDYGWFSMAGIMLYTDAAEHWILELPNPDDISPVIKVGKKVDKVHEAGDKDKENELEKRVADLEDRVLELEVAITKLEAKGSESKSNDAIVSFFDLLGGKRNS